MVQTSRKHVLVQSRMVRGVARDIFIKIVVTRRQSNMEMKIPPPCPIELTRGCFGQFSIMAMGLCHNFNESLLLINYYKNFRVIEKWDN